MGVGLFLLLVFAGIVVLGFVVYITGASSDNQNALTRDQKKELASLRRLVKEINADAHKYQELEPNFTSVVIDKVSNHYQKELES
jgi:predicted ATP-dependent serine protease